MTKINNFDILDNTITAASIVAESGIFSETKSYTPGDQVTWNGKLWLVLNNITGVVKGDLSNVPTPTNPNFLEIKNTVARATNGETQTFSNTAVAIFLGNSISTDEVSVNNSSFTINRAGAYQIRYGIFGDNISNTRTNPLAFVQVNGTQYLASASYGYARNIADGGFSMNRVVSANLNSGDVIEIMIKNSDNTLLELPQATSLFEIEFCANTYLPESSPL